MQKKYLVFISSTFADLEEERKTVMHAIQKAGYFVAGMELFASDDADSWEVIRRAIDQSDYYVLVIAGRYGSLAPDGVSFTEKEYHYAREKKIPVLAFIHSDRDSLPSGMVEKKHIDKLDKFIDLVNLNHTRTKWTTKDDLATNVLATLTQSTYIRPGVGWVRGGVELENETLRERLDDLQQRFERIREERDAVVEELANSTIQDTSLAWSDDKVSIAVEVTLKDKSKEKSTIETTWGRLFRALSPRLIGWESTIKIEQKLLKDFAPPATAGENRKINRKSILLIRSQLVAKGFIDVERSVDSASGMIFEIESWKLTAQGLYEMSLQLAQRKLEDSSTPPP